MSALENYLLSVSDMCLFSVLESCLLSVPESCIFSVLFTATEDSHQSVADYNNVQVE